MAQQKFGGSAPLDIDEIRQSPRQFVDLETVEKLSDYAMVCELKIDRLTKQLEANNPLLDEAADRIESLEQLAKDMAEALGWALANIIEEPYEWSCEEDSDAHNAAIKALSRYREVCGGEKSPQSVG